MALSNNAIWISVDNELSHRPIAQSYEPIGTQVLVLVHYSGINPADIKHGLILGLNDYTSGYEFSGEVIKTGPQAKFSVGDLILGHNRAGKNKPLYYGSHQNVLIGEHFVVKVPPLISMEAAACISIMVQTAADALFNRLGCTGGEVLGEEPDGSPILIWGGASNVGAAAIQLAKAAGLYPILTTASKRNHEALKALGATACFNYRDANVVARIKTMVKISGCQPLKRVFDTIGAPASISLAEQCAEGDDLSLAATATQVGKPQWKMVLATRNVSFPSPARGGAMTIIEANPEWQARIDKAFAWCLAHYGKGQGFFIPNVRVVSGASEGMAAMKLVAEGKASMEKVAIKHPL